MEQFRTKKKLTALTENVNDWKYVNETLGCKDSKRLFLFQRNGAYKIDKKIRL